MKKLLPLLLCVLCFGAYAQITPDTACLSGPVTFNSTKSAVTYNWDFSAINVVQTFAPAVTFTGGFSTPSYISLMKDGSNYYGFLTEYYTGNIKRLNYGSSLYSTPVITNLGSFGATGGNTECIDIVKDSATGNWYGVVVNYSQLMVLSFGSSLASTPTATVTTYPNIQWAHQVTVKRYNGNWIAFIANRNSTVTRCDFGTSLTSTPVLTDLPSTGGIYTPCNFTLYQQSGLWYMLVTDLVTNNLTRYSFGSNLQNNSPTTTLLSSSLLSLPRAVSLYPDCMGHLIGYVVNETGHVIRMDFNGDITNTPVFSDMGATGGSSLGSGAPLAYNDSFFHVMVSFSAGNLSRINPVSFSTPTQLKYFTPVATNTYSAAGAYNLTLFYDFGRPSGPSVGCKSVNIVNCSGITGSLIVCVGGTTALSSSPAGGTWTSSSASIATVGASTGVVTGVSAGTATITYHSGTTNTTAVVTVTASPGAITGPVNVCVGSTITLGNSIPGGTWSSSNASIATIDMSSGVVTGIAAGTATITYMISSSCYKTINITVKPLPAAIVGPATVCVGHTAVYTDPTSGGVSWSSSTPAVGSIGAASGVLTGISAGTTTITFTILTGCTATKVVTVNPTPSPIRGMTSVCVGSEALVADADPGGIWSSSLTGIATVGSTSGVVTGVSAGVTIISYTSALGCGVSMPFTVNPVPAPITGPSSICAGTSAALSDATPGGTWSSSDFTIATVTSAGLVTGITPGGVFISYTLPTGCYRTTPVTVTGALLPPTGTPMTCISSTTALTASIPGGTWTTSNAVVATVNTAGIVTGVSAGTARISYSLGSGCTTYVVVTVNPSMPVITGSGGVCQGYTTLLSNTAVGGTWSSSNPFIATVSPVGLVTGVNVGTATISYVLPSGCFRTMVVTVKQLPGPIVGNLGICVGATTTLTDAGGVSWSSSTPSVATIGATSGVVTGIAPGTTTITFTASTGCTVTAIVTVSPVPVIAPITGPSSVLVGSTITLADATPGGVWSSSNTAKATVSAGGVVMGVAAPAATISYKITSGACSVYATKLITIILAKGISGISDQDIISVYPNPTSGAFVLKSAFAGSFTVFTIDGKEILHTPVVVGENALNLPNGIAAGIYMCRFNGDEGNTYMVRLIYQP